MEFDYENNDSKKEVANIISNEDEAELVITGYIPDSDSDIDEIQDGRTSTPTTTDAKNNNNRVKSDQNDEEYKPPMQDEEEDEERFNEEDTLNDEEEDEELVGDDGYSMYGLRRSKRAPQKSYQDYLDDDDETPISKKRKKVTSSDEEFNIANHHKPFDDFLEDDDYTENNESSDFEENGALHKHKAKKGNRYIGNYDDEDLSDFIADEEYDLGYSKKRKRNAPNSKNRYQTYKKHRHKGVRDVISDDNSVGIPTCSGNGSDESDWGQRNRVYSRIVPSHKVKDYRKSKKSDQKLHDSSQEDKPKDTNSEVHHYDVKDKWLSVHKKHNKNKLSEESISEDNLEYSCRMRRAVVAKKISYKEDETFDEAESNEGEGGDLNPDEAELDSNSKFEPLKSIDKLITHKFVTTDGKEIESENNAFSTNSKNRHLFTVKYLIKWTNLAHIHNTWETEASLREQEVGGLKKLDNYIKNEKEMEKWKLHCSPEDLEYYYCQKEMGDDLLKQYRILERIIASKIIEQITLTKRKVKTLISKDMHQPLKSEVNTSDAINGDLTNTSIEHAHIISHENINNTLPETDTIGEELVRPQTKEMEVEFDQFESKDCKAEYIEEEREVEEKVVEKQIMYLCKWNGLPYVESTWESESLVQEKFPLAIPSYEKRESSERIPYKTCKALRIRPRFSLMKEQPEYIGNCELILRDYQLDGVNWLARSWCKNNSVILADEMGLGKTIQVLSFCNYLFHEHALYGPFLIIAPLSTIAAWQKEASLWAPDFNAVTYLGDVKSREIIQEYEWRHKATNRIKFNFLITTYEILLKDREYLGALNWALLAVDEAHRLKNEDSLLYKELITFRTNFRLLITGTPLQNSLKELWALLHFIMPYRFNDWKEFEITHTNADKSGYTKLHKELEPFILRRVKKDVEKSLPAKVEQILRVEMTSLQKQYYKWILTKNYKALSKGNKGSVSRLVNIVMELKKCCNHTSLTKPDDLRSHGLDPVQHLIRGSGKLLLLDKLLCKLKETGHRVLIFSQMVRMLDIIAEYLQYRCFYYQRLDGSVRNEVRKQALDHFNAENSQDFCFLLSTRAGGLGVNLATADTVIIFDSDWNPQNDLQAQARAHRIGQKNQVNIYRLVTKGSIEEDIIQRAKKKMVLDHLVIQRMNTTGKLVLSGGNNPASSNRTSFNKAELSSILKFGAEDLFKEEKDEEEPQVDIDDILKRAETAEEAPSSLAEELLSQFKVTDFAGLEESLEVQTVNNIAKKSRLKRAVKTEDDKDYTFNDSPISSTAGYESNSSVGEEDSDSNNGANLNVKGWNDIIPKDLRDRVEDEEKQREIMALNKLGPRIRKAIYQNLDMDSTAKKNRQESKFEVNEKHENDRESDHSSNSASSNKKTKSKTLACKSSTILPFNDTEIRKFVKSFKKFPNPQNRLEEIVYDCDLQEKPSSHIKLLCKVMLNKYREAIAIFEKGLYAETEQPGTFKINQVTIPLIPFKKSLEDLENLYVLLPKDKAERKRFRLHNSLKNPNWGISWTNEDDSRLLIGAYEHGIGNWEIIKMDLSLALQSKILPNNNKKPKGKNLLTRIEYLIKTIKSNIPALSQPLQLSKSLLNETLVINHSAKRTSKKSKIQQDDELLPNNSPCIDLKDLPEDIFLMCKEKMRPVKKSLKQLDIESRKVISSESLKSCLLIIGQHITTLCNSEFQSLSPSKIKEWRNYLWIFVSKFTEHDSRYLHKLYKYASRQAEISQHKQKCFKATVANTSPSITMFFKKESSNITNSTVATNYNCTIKTTSVAPNSFNKIESSQNVTCTTTQSILGHKRNCNRENVMT